MPRLRTPLWIAAALLCALPGLSLLAQAPAARSSGQPGGAPYAQRIDVPALTALGRAMFFDAGLSASGRVACASCHDPAHAYGPPNGLAVQPGTSVPPARGGFRAAPSLRYLQSVPPFTEHFFDNDGDDSVDKGPTGGHTWDGRAGSVHEQARLPLLAAAEMGNANEAAVVVRLKRAPYAAQMRAVFGDDVFERGGADGKGHAAFDAALMALEVFQQSPADFYPYTSKYDTVLRGEAALNEQEARGLALFNDAAKGNCASCHISVPTSDGAFPLFTDFGHIAIGVPRNRAIPVNAAASAGPPFFDLGLCGPLRTDLATHAEYCGLFRTPSLRNVAVKQRFFHNGAIASLADAVRFYVERDTAPARWYGAGRRFDDLPPRYHVNINTEPPFGGAPGDRPALDDAEIDAIVAFLKTLTDADQTAAAGRAGSSPRPR